MKILIATNNETIVVKESYDGNENSVQISTTVMHIERILKKLHRKWDEVDK